MKRKIYFMTVGLLLLGIISISLAEEVVDFGNKLCPVSNEQIEEGKEFKYEYKGVNYNLCCEMCVKDFKKDPEKYIEKLKKLKEEEAKNVMRRYFSKRRILS